MPTDYKLSGNAVCQQQTIRQPEEGERRNPGPKIKKEQADADFASA